MEKRKITFEEIKKNEEIKTYIGKADETMEAMGFTEHSFAHVTKAAAQAAEILTVMEYPERTIELARIAGYMHDIGNVINRQDHAQSGAIMSFRILSNLGMEADEISAIVTAIGHHDEGTAIPVNAIAAALILADKSDVRESRVRAKRAGSDYDIHDRVNHAVKKSGLILDKERKTISLHLEIDTEQSAVMDYFEIFLGRMKLCRKAADFLGLRFELVLNDVCML
ncbi:MAG: HD domain-containing protein [Eubacteriales bacterium]|nr:HD domain-containing protein [Eubacteriales bacterium]